MMKNELTTLTAVLLALLAGSGCAEERLVLELDLPSPHLFLHSATFEVSQHAVPEGMTPNDACVDLEREALTGFVVPPLRTYGPYGACEFLAGVELQGLGPELTIYVAVARDLAGDAIATGCEGATLPELPTDEDGMRRLLIGTTPTFNYDPAADPPTPSIEARCGM